MKKCLIFSLFLSISAWAFGQTAAPLEPTQAAIRYDVDSTVLAKAARGECPNQLIEWIAAQNPKFRGDTETLRSEVARYAGGGHTYEESLSGGSYRSGYAYQSGGEMSESAYDRYQYGAWNFGPSYKRKTVAWFVNGRFLFLTNCKARVKFDYKAPRFYAINDLPVGIDYVGRVEIVEDDKNFLQYLPHVTSWRGKAPALIFVTTKSKK